MLVMTILLLKCEATLSMGSQHNNDIAVALNDTSGNTKLALVRALTSDKYFNYAFCTGIIKGHSKVF